jgi:ECF transporter S component (folate family)
MEVFTVKFTTRRLTRLSMLAAIAIVLIILNFPIPIFPPYLKYDFADVPILISSFAFGPVAGVMVTLVASAIQAFVVTADGIYGFLMHAIATSSLAIVAGLVYHLWHTKKGAITALVLGTITMTAVMMLMNHIVTPIYTGWPTAEVDKLLLPQILPFNLLKAGVNSIITFFVYKVVSRYIVHGEPFGNKKNAIDKA